MILNRGLRAALLAILCPFGTSIFADSISVSGKDIEYKWKDGDTIWYEASHEQTEEKEEYSLCFEQFGQDSRWEVRPKIPFSAPCTLVPNQSEVWVTSYTTEMNAFSLVEMTESRKPPGSKLSSKQLDEQHDAIVEKFQANCPAKFKLTTSYDGKGTGGQAVVCAGKPNGKCRAGFTVENDGVTCTKTTNRTCSPLATKHPQENICQICRHGGAIDQDEKRTTLSCGPSGESCIRRYYCKAKTSEIKPL